jgi:hypothetical protein
MAAPGRIISTARRLQRRIQGSVTPPMSCPVCPALGPAVVRPSPWFSYINGLVSGVSAIICERSPSPSYNAPSRKLELSRLWKKKTSSRASSRNHVPRDLRSLRVRALFDLHATSPTMSSSCLTRTLDREMHVAFVPRPCQPLPGRLRIAIVGQKAARRQKCCAIHGSWLQTQLHDRLESGLRPS